MAAQVGAQARLAEGVAARQVHRRHQRLQADVARQVVVHGRRVLVHVRLRGPVAHAARAALAAGLHCGITAALDHAVGMSERRPEQVEDEEQHDEDDVVDDERVRLGASPHEIGRAHV